MFKVITSFKIITALTCFCYLFADLLSRLLVSLQVLWKINGNYLSFACLSNKISFLSYSIFNLLFHEPQLAASAFRGESLSIIPHSPHLCQAFFKTFFIFFIFFLKVFYFRSSSRTACLYYHIIFLLSTLFLYFFYIFLLFFIF